MVEDLGKFYAMTCLKMMLFFFYCVNVTETFNFTFFSFEMKTTVFDNTNS